MHRHGYLSDDSLSWAVTIRFTMQKYYFSTYYANKSYFWKILPYRYNSIKTLRI